MIPPVRVATPEAATVVARLLTEFRDDEGRDFPPAAAMRAGVERLIVRDDTEYLLGGEPALALYRSCGFRSGLDEPGRLGVFMRRRIPENMPPGVS